MMMTMTMTMIMMIISEVLKVMVMVTTVREGVQKKMSLLVVFFY